MAKLLTIKINNEGDVDIKSHLPDGMTEAEMNEHLTIALPMTTACLAEAMSEGSALAARAGLLAMYKLADRLLTKKMKEDDCDDTFCCESDADPDD